MRRLWVWLMACAMGVMPVFALQEINRSEMLKDEAWLSGWRQYVPDPVLLDSLRAKVRSGIHIEVYFAFWCDDSKNNVPKFVAIMDALGAQQIRVRYLETERKKSKEQQYYVEDKKVERIPTFIVYDDEKELGRIVENPAKDMLEDLFGILF
jgi:hypothetical protein